MNTIARFSTGVLLIAGLLVWVAGAAAATPPGEMAKQTVQNILDEMDGRRDELRNNPQELRALINKELVPHIDLPYMSQLVLGRYWRQASPEQRQQFQTAFKNMLIKSYGDALLQFDDASRIQYKRVRRAEDSDRATFNAVFSPRNGQPVNVSLKMHKADGQWKVYDGTAGNLSFVTNYRNQFTHRIQQVGLDQFLQEMNQRYNSGG